MEWIESLLNRFPAIFEGNCGFLLFNFRQLVARDN